MLGRSRISRLPDVGRIGAAMSRPGIDTRTWVSLAVALGESYVDPAHGVYVDVELMPTGEQYTARVPADYAGVGFGFYAKIHKDDELSILIPNGDPGDGVIVSARLWSASDLPPDDANANPDDVILVIEKDKNLRIKVQGQGQVLIDSEATVTVNCPDIRLGDVNPSDAAALAQKCLDELTNVQTDFSNMKAILALHTHPTAGVGPPSPPTPPGDLSTFTPHTPASVASETTKVK